MTDTLLANPLLRHIHYHHRTAATEPAASAFRMAVMFGGPIQDFLLGVGSVKVKCCQEIEKIRGEEVMWE